MALCISPNSHTSKQRLRFVNKAKIAGITVLSLIMLSACGTTSDDKGDTIGLENSQQTTPPQEAPSPQENRSPVAVADTTSIAHNTQLTNFNPLNNDSDPDGDSLSLESATTTTGSAVVNSNNTFSYNPTNNFSGTAVIEYTISDGQATATSNVTVTVAAPPTSSNSVPVVVADTATVNEDDQLASVDVLANDSDPDGDSLTVQSASTSTGSVTVNSDNTLRYTPPTNFFGAVSISYTANDGQASTTGNLAVTVSPVNDAPSASNDSLTVEENSLNNSIDVLNNDSDIDGDSLNISNTSANSGTVSINGSELVYSPDANFSGSDNISYTIQDGAGGTDSATVNVTVTATATPIPTTNLQAGRGVKNILRTPAVGVSLTTSNHNNFGNWTVVSQTNASVSVATDNESVTFSRNVSNDGSNARAYIQFVTGALWPDKDVSICFEVSGYSEAASGSSNVSLSIVNSALSGTKERTATQNGIYCSVLSLSSKTDSTTIRLGLGVTGNDTKTNSLTISKVSVSPTNDGLPNEFVKVDQRKQTASRSGISGASFNYDKSVSYNASSGLTSFSMPSTVEVGPSASHVLSITDSFGGFLGYGIWDIFYGINSINVTPDYAVTMNNLSGRALEDTNPTSDSLLDDMLAEATDKNTNDSTPGVCWIAQGVNDFIVKNSSSSTVFAHFQAHVNWCIDNNMYPVVVTASPFKGAAEWTSSKEVERDAYNTLVKNYVTTNAGNISLVDYDALLDTNNDDTIDSGYSLSDQIHPNEDGMAILSEAAHQIFNQIIAGAD
ncbi:MAG: Ig-like domain-containing protein [Cellvibrionaceae bacterium]